MPGIPKRGNQPIKVVKGPVQPESVLYRILQRIAQEIIKSLKESRGTNEGTGRQSGTR